MFGLKYSMSFLLNFKINSGNTSVLTGISNGFTMLAHARNHCSSFREILRWAILGRFLGLSQSIPVTLSTTCAIKTSNLHGINWQN